MNHKLVSIIIPTYNRASLVGDAILSVQSQSYPLKQIIVIDDGSQDDTEKIVARFEGIEYHRQENKGQAAARNLGLHYAKGEYIATLDSDDIWNPEFLSHSVECLEKHNLDFVFLNYVSSKGEDNFLDIWDRKKKWRSFSQKRDNQWCLLDSKQVRWLFLETCPAPSSSLLLRRSSLVSSWNEEMIIADDWFLILEMVISKPCRAAFTAKPYWLKRINDDNIYDGNELMEITEKLGLHDERIIARHFKSQLTYAEKYILRQRLARHYLNFGRLNLKSEGITKNVFVGVTAAFALAPFKFGSNVTEIIIDYIKHRRKLAAMQNKLRI